MHSGTGDTFAKDLHIQPLFTPITIISDISGKDNGLTEDKHDGQPNYQGSGLLLSTNQGKLMERQTHSLDDQTTKEAKMTTETSYYSHKSYSLR